MPTSSSAQGHVAPLCTVRSIERLRSSPRGETGYTSGLSNSDERHFIVDWQRNPQKGCTPPCFLLETWWLCGASVSYCNNWLHNRALALCLVCDDGPLFRAAFNVYPIFSIPTPSSQQVLKIDIDLTTTGSLPKPRLSGLSLVSARSLSEASTWTTKRQ